MRAPRGRTQSRVPLRTPNAASAKGEPNKRRLDFDEDGDVRTNEGGQEVFSQDMIEEEYVEASQLASKRARMTDTESTGQEEDGADDDQDGEQTQPMDLSTADDEEVVLTKRSGGGGQETKFQLSANYQLYTHEQPISKEGGSSTFSCVAIERRMKTGDQKALRFSWPRRLHHHVCQAPNAIKEPYVKQGPLTLKRVQSMRPDRDGVVHLDSHQLCHDRRRFKIDNMAVQAKTETYKSSKGLPICYEALTFTRDLGEDKNGKRKEFNFSVPLDLLTVISVGCNYIGSERK